MLIKATQSLLASLVLLAASAAQAAVPVCIDGTTDESARQSFAQMIAAASPEQGMVLQMAVFAIALDGIGSAHEVVARPELQNPSIDLIKDRVQGMSADEFIALAQKSSVQPSIEP